MTVKTTTKKTELMKPLVAISLLLSLLGIAWTFYNTNHGNYQNPGVQWIVTIVLALLLVVGSYFLDEWGEGRDGTQVAMRYIPMVLIFFIVVGVVGGTAKTNRDTGIPTEAQIDNSGKIKDPEEYIRYHKRVEEGSNKIYFDTETERYIRTYKRLPNWVVIGGYTQDPVGWISSHPDASESQKDEVLKTRRVE